MATTSKFDFGLINDQINTHSDQIANLLTNAETLETYIACTGYIIRVGNITVIGMMVLTTALVRSQYVSLGTLPSKYTPITPVRQQVVSNGRNMTIFISTTGEIQVKYDGGDPLPSDGKPGISYVTALIN